MTVTINGTGTASLDASGNLNLGSTGARITGDFSNATVANRVMLQNSTANGSTAVMAVPNGSGATGAFQAYALSDPTNSAYCGINADATAAYLRTDARGSGSVLPLAFVTGSSERARFDTAGSLLIRTTSNPDGGVLTVNQDASTTNVGVSTVTSVTTSRFHFLFRNGNGQVGSIATSGTSTAFNTSSDYRLKTNVEPLTGALDRLGTLPVHRFNWIADPDGPKVDGFIAHEAQAVVPEAVTGDKDGEMMQGIDQSKLVPLLTAALQEAVAKIDALEARVAQLEGASA